MMPSHSKIGQQPKPLHMFDLCSAYLTELISGTSDALSTADGLNWEHFNYIGLNQVCLPQRKRERKRERGRWEVWGGGCQRHWDNTVSNWCGVHNYEWAWRHLFTVPFQIFSGKGHSFTFILWVTTHIHNWAGECENPQSSFGISFHKYAFTLCQHKRPPFIF